MIKKLVDFYTHLSRRERWVLSVTALVLGTVLIDRLVVGPVRFQMKLLEIKIRDEETSIKRSLHMLLRKDRIASDAKKFSVYLVPPQKPEEEMTSFLKRIENIAAKSSVSLAYLKPGHTKEDRDSQKYIANLECESQMKEMIDFFYEIENSIELLKIEKYDLQPKSSEVGAPVRCTMTVSRTVFA